MTTAHEDVAAAARLIAAVNAGDAPGWTAVLNAALVQRRLVELCLAVAAQATSLAGEYFDTDAQEFLDRRAFEALSAAQAPDD